MSTTINDSRLSLPVPNASGFRLTQVAVKPVRMAFAFHNLRSITWGGTTLDVTIIPADEAYILTPEWQRQLRESQEAMERGETITFDVEAVDDLLAWLEEDEAAQGVDE